MMMKNIILKILIWKLSLIARLTIKRYKPAVIGVTGNVGKTSAKMAIAAALSGERSVRASSNNFNNELGLPLNIIGDWEKTGGAFFWLKAVLFGVFQLIVKNPRYPEILVLEYGVDRPNDMNYLLDIARAQIGVITAIGNVPVHVEFFSGPDGVAKEKAKLIAQLPATGFAILNADDPKVLKMAEDTRGRVITYGISDKADIKIINFRNQLDAETGEAGISFKIGYNGNVVPFRIPGVLGKTAAYASAVGIAVGMTFGINLVKIADNLVKAEKPTGRLRVLRGLKGSIVIDDTYNASPLAMREALEIFKTLKAKRKIAVLGDMLEIGKYTMEAHEEIGALAAKRADLLITVGLRGKLIAEGAFKNRMAKNSIFSFDNIHEAGRFLQDKLKAGDIVLLKASQGVRLEKVVKEIMAEPLRSKELLVRQDKAWLEKEGIYE
ncbi:MAG: Mur ligase family protein [Patescibacteria group bacterium]